MGIQCAAILDSCGVGVLTAHAFLALEDGSIFPGQPIGVPAAIGGEVVFNTAMSGYQEILTDPSYAKQIITFTFPHIGNVGVNTTDAEGERIYASGLIVRDLSQVHSNWRAQLSLAEYLQQQHITGLAEVDTRALTHILRKKGSLRGMLVTDASLAPQQAVAAAQALPSLQGADLANEVSVQQAYTWEQGVWQWPQGCQTQAARAEQKHVVAYDFGVKRNILRLLASHGVRLTVVPSLTTAEEVLALAPDGVFLSNGPGDPAACTAAIAAIKTFYQRKLPLFGICLGFQLMLLAAGAKTYKMKFGHHGANHPVSALSTQQVMISSQNHGFAVDAQSLPDNWQATHYSLFDRSLQGCACVDLPAFGFQGHPEASPGPHELRPLFAQFVEMLG
jgi:carbamoyl-phosphate synthase small subunit